MSAHNMSDDGKFSTKALRGYGGGDLEHSEEYKRERERGREGGTALSTQVENSDKGQGVQYFHHEERIDEQDLEESRGS